jgi:hypothetical protein
MFLTTQGNTFTTIAASALRQNAMLSLRPKFIEMITYAEIIPAIPFRYKITVDGVVKLVGKTS